MTVRRHTSPPPDTENQLESWAVLEGLTALSEEINTWKKRNPRMTVKKEDV